MMRVETRNFSFKRVLIHNSIVKILNNLVGHKMGVTFQNNEHIAKS